MSISRTDAVSSAEPGKPTELAPPMSRVTVMEQQLPEPLATQRVEIRRITIAPGYAGGLHIHTGPVFGSIEVGSAVYQIEGVRIARFDAQKGGVTFLGPAPRTQPLHGSVITDEQVTHDSAAARGVQVPGWPT